MAHARKDMSNYHQCGGVYGSKYRKNPDLIGTQCQVQIPPDQEFCPQHFVPDEKRCVGHLSMTNAARPGERCLERAMKGQRVCYRHGGNAKQNRAAAKNRIIEEKARNLVNTYGRKIETTATDALLDEVQWTAGHVAWLRERVQEIAEGSSIADEENPLVWGVTRKKTGGEDRGITEEAAPSIWLKLYQQERNHLVRVCESALRAGVEERQVRLAENQGALVAKAINAILGDLDLSAEQAARIPEIVPRHLRALAS